MRTKPNLPALVLLVLLLVGNGWAYDQMGGGYDLTWCTVDGGGETFTSGGDYSLGGTVGQPDAAILDGSNYTLVGGFWGGALPVLYRVYLPLLMRDSS